MSPIRRIVLMASLIGVAACGPDGALPTQPVAPPAAPGEPEVGTIAQVRVEVAGHVIIEVPGKALASMKQGWLVNAAQSTGAGLAAVAPPVVQGDTLAQLSFDVPVSLPNSLYNLRLQFGEAPDAVIRQVSGVLVVARPLPRIDSVLGSSPPGERSPITLLIYGTRLSGLDSIVFGNSLVAVRLPESDTEMFVSDTLVSAIHPISSLVPEGIYDLFVWFGGTAQASSAREQVGSAVRIAPRQPPAIEPFSLTLAFTYPRTLVVNGENLSDFTSLRFELEEAGVAGSAVLPTIQSLRWSEESGTTRESLSGWLEVPPGVRPGPYRLIALDAGLADTVSGALIVPPPAHILPGGSVSYAGAMTRGDPACYYWFDWWNEFVEPCTGYTFTVTEPGQVVFTLDFTPDDCNPYGGLWFSISPPRATYIYDAYCEPYSTKEYPSIISEAGTYAVSIGLHATPDWWATNQSAGYTLTASFAPQGTITAGPPSSSSGPGRIRIQRVSPR